MDNEPDWNLKIMNDFDFVVVIIYFTFTSLSTVGFGDYYPITDGERIISSFILLFGVATFSYTMGELHSVMFNSINNLDEAKDIKLDQFFGLLR